MVYVRRNKRPLFPEMRIWNKTGSPIYIGLKTANIKGITLAANGELGDSVDLYGIDFTDTNTVRTLYRLAANNIIGVAQLNTFYTAYAVPTTTPTTTPSG